MFENKRRFVMTKSPTLHVSYILDILFNLLARFFVAGGIPFFCIFSQTLLQYNAMFALGGMVSLFSTFSFFCIIITVVESHNTRSSVKSSFNFHFEFENIF